MDNRCWKFRKWNENVINRTVCQVWRTPKSRHSDSQMDGQTNGRYQTATDGLIGTEINHELKRQKTQMDK